MKQRSDRFSIACFACRSSCPFFTPLAGWRRPGSLGDGLVRCRQRSLSWNQLAIRSATTIVGRLVLAEGIVGITEASATNSPSMPWTAPRASTTAPVDGSGPMAQVPTGWWYGLTRARIDCAGTVALVEGVRRCCVGEEEADSSLRRHGSDGEGKFGEDRLKPAAGLSVVSEFVVATAQVLNERVSAADHLGAAEPFHAAHRTGPSLQPAVIGFDGFVGVLLHHVPRLGNQLVEDPRVGRGPVGGHLRRPSRRAQGPGEEPAGRRKIPLRRGQNINDLPILVDRPLHVHPAPGELQVGLVDEPAVPGDMPARPGRVDQLGGEPLHPPVDRDVIHRDATFGK